MQTWLLTDHTESLCSTRGHNHKLDLARLPFATGASCNSYSEEHNARYLPNTRTELLDETTIWMNSKDGKSISWLGGMVGMGNSTIAQTVARSRAARSKLLQERRWQARQPLTAFHHRRPVPLRSTSFDQNGSRCGGCTQHVVWRGKESRLAARGDCGAALLHHQTKGISQTSLFRASALGHPCAHNYPCMRTVTYRVLACCITADAAM